MSKSAVKAVKLFERFTDTGLRGRISAKIFSGLLKLIHPRAKVIDDNLKLAYPDSSEKWRSEIRSKVYENLAWTLTETLALQHDRTQALKWVKSVKNFEYTQNLMTQNKGALFITAHFGNWELYGSWMAQQELMRGRNLYVVYQDMHDEDLSSYVRETRERGGMVMMNKDVSVLKMVRLLKSGGHVAVLNDVAGSGKVMVPFMGHDSTNMPGPAVMAMLSGVPVIPACLYRKAPFEHYAEFFDPVEMPSPNLSHDERMKFIIDGCNRAYENFIRKKPELWFWLHKRWRWRP